VAFNPPGTDADARTRVVSLPDSTRRDNLATFPSFGGALEAVPRFGVTVGVATIRELSAEVVMVAHGEDKTLAARRLTAAAGYQSDWPATVWAECRNPHLYLDRAAAPQSAVTH
jgi:glucosamine-6-phosphate deaminase